MQNKRIEIDGIFANIIRGEHIMIDIIPYVSNIFWTVSALFIYFSSKNRVGQEKYTMDPESRYLLSNLNKGFQTRKIC